MKTDSLFYRLFQELPSSFFELIGDRVTRIYLNEIEVPDSAPLSVKVIQLIVLAKNKVRDRVRQLVRQTNQEVTDDKFQTQVLDLIQLRG